MRFMVMIKADRNSEAGVMPGEQLMADMGRFNEELVRAGVMLSGEGLQPSAKGARVRFSGVERSVVDGPFAETQALIAGFWLWQCASLAEAIDWVKRCPSPMGEQSEIEIRQVFEADDFGAEFTPELRAQEERMRAQLAPSREVPVPRGAAPYLFIRGAAQALGFYRRGFGAELVLRLDAPDGSVMHADLAVGAYHFMVSEERVAHNGLSPDTLGGSAAFFTIYVADPDAMVARAVAAGATLAMPVADQFWGDRSGMVTDPFGHGWMFSAHREDPTPDELKRRLAAMFAAAPGGAG